MDDDLSDGKLYNSTLYFFADDDEEDQKIKSGDTVKFLPGGLHLMIIGLDGPLVQGDKVSVTLRFEKAGEIVVSFDVRAMGAPAPGPLSNAADPTFHSPAKM